LGGVVEQAVFPSIHDTTSKNMAESLTQVVCYFTASRKKFPGAQGNAEIYENRGGIRVAAQNSAWAPNGDVALSVGCEGTVHFQLQR
jgi:hypothetical protein